MPPALFLLEVASQNVRASLRVVGSASEDTGRASPYGEVVDTQHTSNPHAERHSSVARGPAISYGASPASLHATARLNSRSNYKRHLSTRRPVASATSTRGVERSETAAGGPHQRRRRTAGLVSDSRACTATVHRCVSKLTTMVQPGPQSPLRAFRAVAHYKEAGGGEVLRWSGAAAQPCA
jgi:hypothetical protein